MALVQIIEFANWDLDFLLNLIVLHAKQFLLLTYKFNI